MPSGGGGVESPSADLYIVDDDFCQVADVAVEVVIYPLTIEIHATMLPVRIVERGNILYFVATFRGDPSDVHFVYTRPGVARPVADPGFGRHESKIRRIGKGIYVAVVDTTGFSKGPIEWHFFGEGAWAASAFDDPDNPTVIRARPPQLL